MMPMMAGWLAGWRTMTIDDKNDRAQRNGQM